MKLHYRVIKYNILLKSVISNLFWPVTSHRKKQWLVGAPGDISKVCELLAVQPQSHYPSKLLR